ncbi:MAG: thiamine diphosphokinase [Shimia sp.]
MMIVVSSPTPVTLLGGGPVDADALRAAHDLAPRVVCADGGANTALAHGIAPDAVIGDFDSISAEARTAFRDRLHPRPDQNSTDLEKAIAATDAPLLVGVGFLGGRIDHQMASLSALLKTSRPIVLVHSDELAFIAPMRLALELSEGTPIGLYPMLRCRLTSTGLAYPLANAEVAPDGLISTSNRVTAPSITLETDRRAILVTLPLAALPLVAQALAPHAAPAR